MKLIGSLTSPYVRKVRIVLHEKKIDHEFIVDAPQAPNTRVPEFNPLGKVPVLMTDDGMVLFDSAVIVDFLESATPNNRLLPQTTNRLRAMVKCAEALAGGVCDAGAAIYVEKSTHAPEQISERLIANNLIKIERALAKIARDLGEATYLFEGAYGLADIATGCALGFVDVLNDRGLIAYDWRSRYPALVAYLDRLNERPSFVDTRPTT